LVPISALGLLTRVRGIWRGSKLRFKCYGTHAETRFRPSAKRRSPFKTAGASVQSTTGSRVLCISGSNAGYTMFRGSVKGTGTHSIRQFPLHFPPGAPPCGITFQLDSTRVGTDEEAPSCSPRDIFICGYR